jgi:hypothetical protein
MLSRSLSLLLRQLQPNKSAAQLEPRQESDSERFALGWGLQSFYSII